MPRRPAPLTIAAIWQDGPALRVADLVAVTGLSPDTIRNDIAAGELRACRRGVASPYLIERTAGREWLARMGFRTTVSALTVQAPVALQRAEPVGTGGIRQPTPFPTAEALLQAALTMGLADLVRNAVATANRLTTTLQATVSYRAWIGHDGYKAIYASPIQIAALIELTQAVSQPVLVRTASGEEKAARAKVLFLTPLEANGAADRTEPIDPRDEITLPDGSTGPILSIQGTVDPSTGGAYAAEVWIG